MSNENGREIIINVVPEGHHIPLAIGEWVKIDDAYDQHPVTLQCNRSGAGVLLLSIWPGDGEICDEMDGVDVLDVGRAGNEPVRRGAAVEGA